MGSYMWPSSSMSVRGGLSVGAQAAQHMQGLFWMLWNRPFTTADQRRINWCITRLADRKADLSGRRNGSKVETVMTTHKRASDRSTRGNQSSPGRPKAAHREQHVAFWKLISKGLSSEDAAVQVGASAPVGGRWFREAGGMPPSQHSKSSPPAIGAISILR